MNPTLCPKFVKNFGIAIILALAVALASHRCPLPKHSA